MTALADACTWLHAWLRQPFDRCCIGGHRMATKRGSFVCRKHWADT